MNKELIVFEDDIIIIINKPSGLLTQSSENSNKKDLYHRLQTYLDKREGKHTYLDLHHRLDAATSGLILFCKNKKYNKQISDLFSKKTIEKTYLAVTEILDSDKLQNEWIISNKLKTYKFKHFKKAKSANKGLEAITHFKLIKKIDNRALIECHPKTGRLHQLRVHLSESGLPVVGDFHYNKNRTHEDLMLHASRLKFIHPKTKKEINIICDPPSFFPIQVN